MGFLDLQCDGCGRKFPLDAEVTTGSPKEGTVRNLGGMFSAIYICPSCWNTATEKGFKLDSKEDAKRWKATAEKAEHGRIQAFESNKTSKNRKDQLEEASKQMVEALDPEIEILFADVLLPTEKVICKVRSSPSGNRSQLVLTNQNLIIINKGLAGGQGQDAEGFFGTIMAAGRISIRIYPVREIRSVEIQPQQGMSVGHFQVLTNATSENDNESKFLFDTDLGYYKAILIYRKIRELQGFAPQRKSSKPAPPPPSAKTPQVFAANS